MHGKHDGIDRSPEESDCREPGRKSPDAQRSSMEDISADGQHPYLTAQEVKSAREEGWKTWTLC